MIDSTTKIHRMAMIAQNSDDVIASLLNAGYSFSEVAEYHQDVVTLLRIDESAQRDYERDIAEHRAGDIYQ